MKLHHYIWGVDMANLDRHGFKKIRKGAWWQVLGNYKISGMKITLTLKQNPRGRKRKDLVHSGVITELHWDDLDEYVSLRDENNKLHRFLVSDLCRLETIKNKEGVEIETIESDET